MKHFILFILIFIVVTFSCRYDCGRATASISLVAFQPAETDTVIVRRYTRSSNFTILLDSFLLNASTSQYSPRHDTLEIFSSFGGDNGLRAEYDYEIYLPKVNTLFQVSEIQEDVKSSGNFLSCTKESCINSFKSYKMNGDPVNVSSLYTFYFVK